MYSEEEQLFPSLIYLISIFLLDPLRSVAVLNEYPQYDLSDLPWPKNCTSLESFNDAMLCRVRCSYGSLEKAAGMLQEYLVLGLASCHYMGT